MCFSPNASLISFSTNLISSILLYQFEPVVALFFMYIGIMQIYDYIFWNNHKNTINFYTTKLAFLTNIAGPIFLAILLRKKLKFESQLFLVIYSACAIIYIINGWKEVDYTIVSIESAPSLYWKWNYLPGQRIVWTLYILLVLLIFAQHFNWPLNIIICIIVFGSYVFSYFRFKQHVSGRFWCYYGGFMPILIVIFCIFKKLI